MLLLIFISHIVANINPNIALTLLLELPLCYCHYHIAPNNIGNIVQYIGCNNAYHIDSSIGCCRLPVVLSYTNSSIECCTFRYVGLGTSHQATERAVTPLEVAFFQSSH